MTKLPDRSLLDGTKNPDTTTGEFRLAMGNLRQYLFELLGEEGTDNETARLTMGIDLAELLGKISEKAGKQDVETALALKADSTELSGVAFTGNYNDLIDKPAKSDTLEGYGIITDSVPTDGSTKPVTSGGIKIYVDTSIAGAVVPCGMQVFTANGTFTVPPNVTTVRVGIVGGGGGGGNSYITQYYGYGGGTSSFGSFVTTTGGMGAGSGFASGGSVVIASNVSGFTCNGSNGGCGIHTLGGGSFLGCSGYKGGTGYGYGGWGNGWSPDSGDPYGRGGGGGGYADVFVSGLTSGVGIAVTIGGAGTPKNWEMGGAGGAGVCIIEW